MLDRTLCIAPMMGCTDRHCRYLLRLLSPHALIYSEMVVTGALIHGNAPHFLQHHGDEPVALQLGGSDPSELARCAVLAQAAGYQEVNLNVGCPSDRVQSGGIGACLMATPDLVAECFRAMQQEVDIPVTIKSRIGIDKMDSFEEFERFIEPIHAAGCQTFVVHARIAVLSGLSPKDNREIPPLKYDYVYDIQALYPDAEFILNGGIKTVNDATNVLSRTKGVMLGRAPYSAPFLLAELDHAVYGTTIPSHTEVTTAFRAYMIDEMSTGTHIKHMAKHTMGLFAGLPGARAYRRQLSERMFADDARIEVFDEALGHVALDTDLLVEAV